MCVFIYIYIHICVCLYIYKGFLTVGEATHPSSSYMRRMILSTSRTLEPSSSSSSNSSSPRACGSQYN